MNTSHISFNDDDRSSLSIEDQPAKHGYKLASKRYILIAIVLWLIVIAAHVFRLADVPAGLYMDESSIGYNAALIAQEGVDEYGVRFPTYFKAFGEYKNPIYIYASALLFKLFGVSVFNLRLTSCLFFLAGLFFTLLLTARLFPKNRFIQLYTLISLGFLPVFFVLSRVSFEAISQLTWVAATNLLVWLTFHGEHQADIPKSDRKNRHDYLKATVCGLLLGTSIYTYSTARLLSGLMLISLWAVYFSKKDSFKQLRLITITFLIALVPYLYFVRFHRGATTGRFKIISYLDDPISTPRKVFIFIQNYFEYWSPDFLLLSGDANLRHSIGHGGIIFGVTLLLFLVAIAAFLLRKPRSGNQQLNRFTLFLSFNLLASPVAASLTSESVPHSLRSLLLGYYILLVSCYGLAFIQQIKDRRLKRGLLIGLSCLLVFEVAASQIYYFGAYPAKSIGAMESFDIQTSLQRAIAQNPDEIIFVNQPAAAYANLAFYTYLVDNPQNIPLTVSPEPELTASNTCILYHKNNESALDSSLSAPFTELEYAQPLTASAQPVRDAQPVEPVTKVRCYEKPA